MQAPILVRKYGGTSLADVPRLREIARNLKACRDRGWRLVVVVSAMGQTTDELAAQARAANPEPPRREMDMLLSVGERITMSLLCMALAAEKCPALSLTGSQCGIITDDSHTDARILEVKGDRVRDALAAGYVVVVAGFQGVSRGREITTLGRGGSDATAVALAAALSAERCEILKDVDGVMTADPRVVPAATPHDALSYDEMQAIADAGCGVVHPRAVAYARDHGVPLVVGSSFSDGPGTVVGAPAPTPPGSQGAGFTPLVLNLDAPCDRLCASWSGPEQATRVLEGLATADADALLAEWLTRDDRGSWEGWGAPELVDRLARAIASEGPVRTRDHACISLPGMRPRTWATALAPLRGWLAARGLADVPLRTDGAAVRLLVPAASARQLAQDLHGWAFRA